MKRYTCLLLVVVLVAGLVTAGCYSPPPPKRPLEIVRTDIDPGFNQARENLVDIVVLDARPPEGNPRTDGPHLRQFRRLVYEGLIEKGYSPLKLTFVDKKNAGDPRADRVDPDHNRSRFNEDAIIALSLNGWDTRYLRDEGGIMVSATLSLIQSRPETKKLFMQEIRNKLYLVPPTADDVNLTIDEVVVDKVVEDLLKTLPPRA